jgi:protein-S-isoprenylcysteine O-methyltransferase Ste14
MSMRTWVFSGVIFIEGILGLSLILTILSPRIRVWPPPSRNSWQYWYTWSLTVASVIGVIAIGILDWGSLGLDQPGWKVAGGALILSGSTLALWAVRILTIRTSLGLSGTLTLDGPYRYTRNPQYVGDIVLTLGYVLLSNSWMALAAGLLGSAWFVLAPFTEEPWLRERYGAAYERYMAQIPRFIGIPKKS